MLCYAVVIEVGRSRDSDIDGPMYLFTEFKAEEQLTRSELRDLAQGFVRDFVSMIVGYDPNRRNEYTGMRSVTATSITNC
jgi:hypothetical protein